MLNPIRKRRCTVCNEKKKTTNDDEPYICEGTCLRGQIRDEWLNRMSDKTKIGTGLIILAVVFMFGILIGKYLI